MLVKTLKRAGIGFLIGMVVGNLISVLSAHGEGIVTRTLLEHAGSLPMAIILQTLLSGAIGAFAFGGVSLYEIESWPLLLITAVHYAIYMTVFVVSDLILGWYATAFDIVFMAVILAVIHFIIFLIMCAVYRAQVKKLNEMQKEYQIKENENIKGGTEQ